MKELFHGLGAELRSKKETILLKWISDVEEETRIPTAVGLDDTELRNHMGSLLDNLSDVFSDAGADESIANALTNAKIHGDTRWLQKFNISELLRETAILRTLVVEQVVHYVAARSEFTPAAEVEAHIIVHRFFDALTVDSVTEFARKQLAAVEEARAALEERNQVLAEKNEQLKALDASRLHMLRVVVHELRDPLNMLMLTANLLESEEPEERSEAVHSILRVTAALADTLEQLLDFSMLREKDKRQIGPVDLTSLFEDVAHACQLAAKQKGLNFIASKDPSLTAVVSDARQLRMVARNLLTNAVKYCEAGEVEFSFREVDDHSWAIEVRDTGHGIPEAERARIFEEFYRLKGHAQKPGTGLGLAIVREAAELLGGDLELQSEVGKGSKFIVRLPRAVKSQPTGSE